MSPIYALNDITTATVFISHDLNHLTAWATTQRVTFNVEKTVFMIVTKKTAACYPDIKVHNTTLKQVYNELSWNIISLKYVLEILY